jgi:integrase/DNA-directed RNA polymerase subunit M/transcription elongation factor TFIIS
MAEAGREGAASTMAKQRAHGNFSKKSGLTSDGKLAETPAAQPFYIQPQPEKAATKDMGLSFVNPSFKCPECGSERPFYKDGLRYLKDGSTVQRYLCRSCGYRFSDQKRPKIPLQKIPRQSLNNGFAYTFKRQVCDETPRRRALATQKGLAVLAAVDPQMESPMREGTAATQTANVKGKIVEFIWNLKKNGYSPSTIKIYSIWLNALTKRGADLQNPESVKETVAQQEKWTSTSKANAIAAYKAFADFLGVIWKPPKYAAEKSYPFIPLESELDALIAASGKKTSALLQLLKETGMRIGEALRLRWTDIDVERHVITINNPEKGSNPRVIKISPKLMGMLNALPKESQKIFEPANQTTWRRNLLQSRKRIAAKLQNPRLEQITFHTFRHWKGTMEYHRTKDPYYVKNLLGHKSIRNTEVYINIEHAIFQSETDEFTVKIAEKPEEIKALLEVGFEYVCAKDGLMFFRKRK